jgi:hypothetical protein
MSALSITAQEFARSQQARAEVRTIMTDGTTGGGVVHGILTTVQYDTAGSPTPDFNEAVALATIRALSKLPVLLPQYAKAALPTASTNTGAMIFVSDDVGGSTPAFSDGTNWRRVADRAIVS